MALPNNICDREMDKFTENAGGETCVNTCTESVPGGLSTAWLVTTLDIGTTSAKIPTTNLTARRHVVIYNTDASSTLYLGPTTGVTADNVVGTTSGWEVGPGDQFHVDITDTIDIYGIVASGTVRVKVAEYS